MNENTSYFHSKGVRRHARGSADASASLCEKERMDFIIVFIAFPLKTRYNLIIIRIFRQEGRENDRKAALARPRHRRGARRKAAAGSQLCHAGPPLGFSPNHLSRRFRRSAGIGLHEYIVFVRLHHAAQELIATGDTITDIALRCGFSDSNYFKDSFKKKYGVTPRDYRKMS